jgi:threonine/homoserine/homoserine lactone efflux protein
MLFMALQWLGAAYLVWLGLKMITAKAGEGSGIQITPGHYLRQTMFITLLNPKAILFYFAFFPQFIDPANYHGGVTFVAMALTIAVLGLAYCSVVVLLTHFMVERIRAQPSVSAFLQKLAGLCLLGFGLKMVLAK